jgi:hypothetical protein
MNKKNLILWVIIGLIALALIFFLVKSLDSKNKPNKEVEKVDLEIMDESNLNEDLINKQNLVVKYLEDNISQLSPEKEVLGGKFYLTSLDFISDQEVIVSYEDGHIALVAKVTFTLEQKNSPDKEVIIESFEIIEN